MLKFEEKDFVPIDSYTNNWRWLSDKNKLTNIELAGIKPLSPGKSEEAYEYSIKFQGQNYWDYFNEKAELDVELSGLNNDEIGKWLSDNLPSSNSKIYITWTKIQAAEASLKLFIRYWDTFCFPLEDVVIWPENEKWVLLFDYKQRFYLADSKT